jgi:hypothetical protein
MLSFLTILKQLELYFDALPDDGGGRCMRAARRAAGATAAAGRARRTSWAREGPRSVQGAPQRA